MHWQKKQQGSKEPIDTPLQASIDHNSHHPPSQQKKVRAVDYTKCCKY